MILRNKRKKKGFFIFVFFNPLFPQKKKFGKEVFMKRFSLVFAVVFIFAVGLISSSAFAEGAKVIVPPPPVKAQVPTPAPIIVADKPQPARIESVPLVFAPVIQEETREVAPLPCRDCCGCNVIVNNRSSDWFPWYPVDELASIATRARISRMSLGRAGRCYDGYRYGGTFGGGGYDVHNSSFSGAINRTTVNGTPVFPCGDDAGD